MGRTKARVENAERLINRAILVDEGIKVTFADGCEGLVPFYVIPEAGKPPELTSIELPNPSEIIIRNSNGKLIELPWDFIRHYCDSTYREKVEKIAVASTKSLGQRIRTYREERNMTQAELALKAGIGRVTELRIEKGEQSPRYATLKSIAEALKHPMTDLISVASKNDYKGFLEIDPIDTTKEKENAGSEVKQDGIDLVSSYIAKSREKTEKAFNKALENDWETSLKLVREAEALAPSEWHEELNVQINLIWRCIQKMYIGPLVIRAEDLIKMWDYAKASVILANIYSILQVAKLPLDFEDFSIRVVNIARVACSEADRWENTFDNKLDRTLVGVSYIKSNLEELIEKDANRRSFVSKQVKDISAGERN